MITIVKIVTGNETKVINLKDLNYMCIDRCADPNDERWGSMCHCGGALVLLSLNQAEQILELWMKLVESNQEQVLEIKNEN